MTIPSAGAEFGVALQPDKIGEGGTFDGDALDFYKVRASRVAVGPLNDQQIFPQEIGTLVPTGAYKQQLIIGGQVDLIPRLENSLGVFLYAALGSVSSVSGTNADGEPVVGVNTHIFRYDPDDQKYMPWMAVRRSVPGITSEEDLGESMFDCKIAQMTFIVPAKGKVQSQVTMLGRDYVKEDPADWTWENGGNYEASLSTADAGRGQFKIAGDSKPALGAQFTVANGLTTPDQEAIIGSFRMDDLVALSRSITVQWVYKYENPDMYQEMMANGADETDWSSIPFLRETEAGVFALDVRTQAPENIGATDTPYELRIRANRVTVAQPGPIELVAGGIVTQTFTLTVLDPETSDDYIHFVLVNGVESY